MKKLCFGSLVTVLVKCKAPTTTQKQLIGIMLRSVNELYDIGGEDGTTSALALGRTNLSEYVIVYAKEVDPIIIAAYFKEKVIPLLDLNRRGTIILALKDIIAADHDITDDRVLETINQQTKADILARDTFVLEDFLAGLFLYTAIYTTNNNREKEVREIADNYIKGFDSRRNEISFVDSYGLKNMDILDSVSADARALSLLAEESGRCPCCARPLVADKTMFLNIAQGVDILLCTSCYPTVQNSSERKAELAELKRKMRARSLASEAIAYNRMSEEIRELIKKIGNNESITVSQLRMSPLRVEQKVSDRLLMRKVKSYVIDGMYEIVNEAIEQLASASILNVRQFERSIKRMYEDAEDCLASQSDIFNELVQYLYAKSDQQSYEACEIVISYFVQRCEVFHEISG